MFPDLELTDVFNQYNGMDADGLANYIAENMNRIPRKNKVYIFLRYSNLFLEEEIGPNRRRSVSRCNHGVGRKGPRSTCRPTFRRFIAASGAMPGPESTRLLHVSKDRYLPLFRRSLSNSSRCIYRPYRDGFSRTCYPLFNRMLFVGESTCRQTFQV